MIKDNKTLKNLLWTLLGLTIAFLIAIIVDNANFGVVIMLAWIVNLAAVVWVFVAASLRKNKAVSDKMDALKEEGKQMRQVAAQKLEDHRQAKAQEKERQRQITAQEKAQQQQTKIEKAQRKAQKKVEKAENKRLNAAFVAETQRIEKKYPSVSCRLMEGIVGWDHDTYITVAFDAQAREILFRKTEGRREASLAFDKIFDIWTGTEKDVELRQKGGGVIRGAVAGAVFNPFVGIMVANNKKTKEIVNVSYYLVISYHPNPEQDTAIVLESGSWDLEKFSKELMKAVNIGGGIDASIAL